MRSVYMVANNKPYGSLHVISRNPWSASWLKEGFNAAGLVSNSALGYHANV